MKETFAQNRPILTTISWNRSGIFDCENNFLDHANMHRLYSVCDRRMSALLLGMAFFVKIPPKIIRIGRPFNQEARKHNQFNLVIYAQYADTHRLRLFCNH